YDIPHGADVIDVGTGAGFPGVPLKIARPDINLTLLDSLGKRVKFLAQLSQLLGQSGNNCIHERAEQAANKSLHREKFDAAVSRAVAALPALCEYAMAFVKPGGVFIALKGGGAEREARDGQSAIRLMGGELSGVVRYTLPDGSARSIVVIKKISQTPPKYPRISARITKTPL
ncbi:MAG: 16S rRNA (guanine(527)-N(7))-methyltransferase RsmG, partial [Oscillospiraceae bacterium]|nr:16S rRNA (guanine(527)-N(7))-methyltransferase RsmG [Oscillospiraceae bacterium]